MGSAAARALAARDEARRGAGIVGALRARQPPRGRVLPCRWPECRPTRCRSSAAVFHILLDASDDTLRRRIEASAEARQWRLDHLTEYRQARGWLRREADLVLDTTLLTADQAAREIASALPSLANRHS